jgi:hypothetical protein
MSKIYAFDANSGDSFGDSVSIDATTLIVGSEYNGQGAVYCYESDTKTGKWTLGAYLEAGIDGIAADAAMFGSIVSSHDNSLGIVADGGYIYTYDLNNPSSSNEVKLSGESSLDVHSNTLVTRRPVVNKCKCMMCRPLYL